LCRLHKSHSIWPCSGQAVVISALGSKFCPPLVYDHAGCTEYCKYFAVAIKMINDIDKKQMYDSVIMRQENASKDWNCIISMFLMSLCLFCVWLCMFYVFMP